MKAGVEKTQGNHSSVGLLWVQMVLVGFLIVFCLIMCGAILVVDIYLLVVVPISLFLLAFYSILICIAILSLHGILVGVLDVILIVYDNRVEFRSYKNVVKRFGVRNIVVIAGVSIVKAILHLTRLMLSWGGFLFDMLVRYLRGLSVCNA